MPDDKDQEKEKAVTEDGKGGRSSAEERVREIKRKKEAAKRAAEVGESESEAEEPVADAKSEAEARVREIKRKKEAAKRAAEAGESESEAEEPASADAKSAAEARVREIKRKKEAAKRAAEAGESESEAEEPVADAKSAAEARVREIKRRKEQAKQGTAEADGAESAKLSAEERVREIKRKKEEAKRAAAGVDAEEASADAKMSAQERVREIKRKKELAKQAAAEGGVPKEGGMSEREKKIAAMKAKARVKQKAAAGDGKPEAPEEPSPNQPLLEKYVKVIQQKVGEDALEEAYINRLAKDVPTVVAKPQTYRQIAELLKSHEELAFDYLSDIHGGDYETHMEVYVHLYSFRNRQPIALKVKLSDRENPEIDSLAPLWKGADWPERETYDLLGIRFKGHPNLKRIMMPDDWVGHPLRKDYEPYDVEV